MGIEAVIKLISLFVMHFFEILRLGSYALRSHFICISKMGYEWQAISATKFTMLQLIDGKHFCSLKQRRKRLRDKMTQTWNAHWEK
jgi:hypothetical protein